MWSLDSLVDQLRTVNHFISIPDPILKEIVNSGQVRHFSANSIIFKEGDPAAGMHVLLRGQVRLTKIGLQGIESIIYILKSVVMFNETTVIDNQPNPVTAITDLDTITWQIYPESYQALMRKYPVMGLGLLKILAARNRLLLARYDDMISRPVLARTAKILVALSNSGELTIDRYEHPNHRIAAMAATVPEAVSRALHLMKKEEIIECTRGRIKILSIDKLANYAQAEPILLEYINRL